jgi:hypothetical protein
MPTAHQDCPTSHLETYEFDRQGCLVIPDMLTPEQVQALAQPVDDRPGIVLLALALPAIHVRLIRRPEVGEPGSGAEGLAGSLIPETGDPVVKYQGNGQR